MIHYSRAHTSVSRPRLAWDRLCVCVWQAKDLQSKTNGVSLSVSVVSCVSVVSVVSCVSGGVMSV